MMRALIALGFCLLCTAPRAQDVLDDLRDGSGGYAQVVPGKVLAFPRDHAAHPAYRIEWWYLTANLLDPDQRHWGLQWTLFRQAMSPDPAPQDWSNNQMWMAHAAITTPDGHVHEERFARGGIGQAGVNSIERDGFFNAWMDDWQWRSSAPALFPAELRFTVDDYEVVMQLDSNGALVANGINGYSQKSAQGQASYYYSQPHIRVQGMIRQGSTQTQLRGQGWLDREWSSQALADNQQGWDWFSLHLDDGHKLMVYQLRHDDGEHWISGSWIDPQGSFRHLQQDDIDLQLLQTRKVNTGEGSSRVVPLEWRIRLPDLDRSWRVRPLYDDQWMATRIPYWEGVVLVSDGRDASVGVGYMELTGYE